LSYRFVTTERAKLHLYIDVEAGRRVKEKTSCSIFKLNALDVRVVSRRAHYSPNIHPNTYISRRRARGKVEQIPSYPGP